MKVDYGYVQKLREKCKMIADKYLSPADIIAMRIYRTNIYELAPKFGVLKKIDREIFALGHTLFELLKDVPDTLLDEEYNIGKCLL